MTTAVDTNILFDIALSQPSKDASAEALIQAKSEGALIIGDVVYSELAGRFDWQEDLDAFLTDLEIELLRSTRRALHLAGVAWRQYARSRAPFSCPQCGAEVQATCHRCGSPLARRQHVLADFLIGAHAQALAGRLLTRDRGYYARYFPGLVLV